MSGFMYKILGKFEFFQKNVFISFNENTFPTSHKLQMHALQYSINSRSNSFE